MNALGELFIYVIYGVFIILSIAFFMRTLISKKKWAKWIWGSATAFWFTCLIFFAIHMKNVKRSNDLSIVGTYNLTQYPNCINCKAVLDENYTFTITNGIKVFEKGIWRYEVGGDYFVIYLNKNGDQLGSGDYKYNTYKLKYP